MSDEPLDRYLDKHFVNECIMLNSLPSNELEKKVEWRTKAPWFLRLFRSSLFFYPTRAEKSYISEGILEKRRETQMKDKPDIRYCCHNL